MTLGYKFASYILYIFSIFFVQYTKPHPFKNLPISDSGDDIICQSSVSNQYFEEKKYWNMCLPKNWLLDQNSIAHLSTIAFLSPSRCCLGISDIANANCSCMFVS